METSIRRYHHSSRKASINYWPDISLSFQNLKQNRPSRASCRSSTAISAEAGPFWINWQKWHSTCMNWQGDRLRSDSCWSSFCCQITRNIVFWKMTNTVKQTHCFSSAQPIMVLARQYKNSRNWMSTLLFCSSHKKSKDNAKKSKHSKKYSREEMNYKLTDWKPWVKSKTLKSKPPRSIQARSLSSTNWKKCQKKNNWLPIRKNFRRPKQKRKTMQLWPELWQI